MSKTGFDHDALVEQFAQASAKQGEALRQAVQQATLKALQGRELTLKSVRDAVKSRGLGPSRTEGESVLTATSVVPAWSSMTWAYMCFDERNTVSRGRSGVPVTRWRIRALRRFLCSLLLLIVASPGHLPPLPALPAFVRIFSMSSGRRPVLPWRTRRTPLPL